MARVVCDQQRQLAKLFLSSNRVASVAPLVPLKALETLCLFRNSIPAADFSRTLEDLGTLPKLAELDLDGNPCAKGKGFKHHVVMALPRLCQLVRLSFGARYFFLRFLLFFEILKLCQRMGLIPCICQQERAQLLNVGL